MVQQLVRDPGLFPGLLTDGLPGIGGVLRQQPTDFCVTEIPAYAPSGSGQHVLFEIEKVGISTQRAIRHIAHALGVPSSRIGSAGLKDAHAVTRQWLSVEGVTPKAVQAVELRDLRVLSAQRHRNRLKIGHLRGNRFVIRVRDVSCDDALDRANAIVQVLQQRGLPNTFGPQRFGLRQNTHLLGQALLRRSHAAFLSHYLGRPQADDPPSIQQARAAYEDRDLATALLSWPSRGDPEYRVLSRLDAGDSPRRAIQSIPRSLRRLYVSAYQSYLFNWLLADRLDTIDQLELGDLAVKHTNGAFFCVDDLTAEQPRADSLEISPSGPLYGHKVRLAQREPGDRERTMLHRTGLTLESFRLGAGVNMRGSRRPLRVPLRDVALERNEGLMLRFSLPPGAYATSLLAEVQKGPMV